MDIIKPFTIYPLVADPLPNRNIKYVTMGHDKNNAPDIGEIILILPVACIAVLLVVFIILMPDIIIIILINGTVYVGTSPSQRYIIREVSNKKGIAKRK